MTDIITNSLDEHAVFNRYLRAALQLGILHVIQGRKRLPVDKLLAELAYNEGRFSARRFQHEILNRAYGLSFVNDQKQAWVRKNNQ